MSERCGLCGSDDRPHHDELVANHVIHHRWSPGGTLEAVSPTPVGKRSPQQQIMVVGAIDTTLRKILLAKGLVTDADFTAVLDPGNSPEGDRGGGEAPSP